jgi:putative transposase
MPNSRRFHLADLPQHIVQRGNNGQACFERDEHRCEYLSRLAAGATKYSVSIHAYVLMSNHVHLLATPTSPNGISRLMQAVGGGYVRSFNASQNRTGTLWDGRFFSSLVGSDHYLWSCHRYIELNPVRAGIVSQPGGFRWSSHGRNAYGRPDPAVTPHAQYLALSRSASDACAAYRSMFESVLDQSAIAEIRRSLRTERAYADEDFLDRVEGMAGRSPRPRGRGRPRAAAPNGAEDLNNSDLFTDR